MSGKLYNVIAKNKKHLFKKKIIMINGGQKNIAAILREEIVGLFQNEFIIHKSDVYQCLENCIFRKLKTFFFDFF